MRLDFYLLASGGPEAALAPLAGKVLESGGRLLVVAEQETERQRLSDALWAYRPNSFLANAPAAGQPADAHQPILISNTLHATNGAKFLALADGQWREPEPHQFERVLLVFNDATRAPARDIWRMAKARADWDCHFFKQEAGRWVKAG